MWGLFKSFSQITEGITLHLIGFKCVYFHSLLCTWGTFLSYSQKNLR
jgi:hypothetical protein